MNVFPKYLFLISKKKKKKKKKKEKGRGNASKEKQTKWVGQLNKDQNITNTVK
jgi:hypothetical protein